jgi:hypothetical protein
MVLHAGRPNGGVNHDVEPEDKQQPEADGEHPEPGKDAHQRKHQQRVGDNHQGKQGDPAPYQP